MQTREKGLGENLSHGFRTTALAGEGRHAGLRNLAANSAPGLN